MLKFLRGLFKLHVHQRMPRLGNGFAIEYDRAKMTPAEAKIISLGIARDPQHARELIAKHGTDDPRIIAARLPRPRANWRKRLKNWVASVEGGYTSNPMRKQFRDIENEGDFRL